MVGPALTISETINHNKEQVKPIKFGAANQTHKHSKCDSNHEIWVWKLPNKTETMKNKIQIYDVCDVENGTKAAKTAVLFQVASLIS